MEKGVFHSLKKGDLVFRGNPDAIIALGYVLALTDKFIEIEVLEPHGMVKKLEGKPYCGHFTDINLFEPRTNILKKVQA